MPYEIPTRSLNVVISWIWRRKTSCIGIINWWFTPFGSVFLSGILVSAIYFVLFEWVLPRVYDYNMQPGIPIECSLTKNGIPSRNVYLVPWSFIFVPVAWKVYNLPLFRSCPLICTSPCVSVSAGRWVKESEQREKQKRLRNF